MIHDWLCRLIEMPLVLNILLKVTVLLAVAWAAHLLLRQRNAYWRILLWRGVGVAIVAVPLLAWLTPAIPIAVSAPAGGVSGTDVEALFSPASIDEPLMDAPLENSADSAKTASGPLATSPTLSQRIGDWFGDYWEESLLAIWAAGLCLLTARWMIVWARLRRVLCGSTAASDHERQCLHRAARMLGCDGAVQLRVAEHVAGPLLAGVRRPVILLPRKMATASEPSALSAILAHELIHLRNRDLPWMGVLRAIAVVFWWHPLAWIMCRAHGQACEEVCDAVAAAHVGDRDSYSRTLARVALAALAPTPALAGVPMARPAEIMRRLSRLQATPTEGSRPGLRQIVTAGAVGAALLLALSGLQLVYAASTAPADATARMLHFPADRSLGTVWIQDANQRREIKTFYYWSEDTSGGQSREPVEARGDVAVPPGCRAILMISRDGWKDLSPLTRLAPDDIYSLSVSGTGLSAEASEERGFLPKARTNAGDAIMPHIAHLTGLKSLDLHTTEVTGSGLRHIVRMKALESLTLPRKVNDGGMVYVAKLTGLKRLYFKENNVTNKGLAKLAELSELEELELGGKRMSDEGLIHLKKLPRLQYLMLWGNTFTDAGMVHVREIRSLRIFWPFRMSTIGDEGLGHLSSLPNIERLNLCYNDKITDVGMAHVARMSSLRQLAIRQTRISDVGAEHLQRLKNLDLLELPDGISRPAMADLLATKPRLRVLWCGSSSNSTYGDEVLEQVGKMADIEKLSVSGISMTDAGVAGLTRCTRLKDVSLFSCPITSKGLAELGKIASLERLYLHDAKLTTSGLRQLNGLSRLEWLSLSEVTPDEGFMDISGLTSLRHLTLGARHNGPYLRDDDLACLAKLTDLEWLQLSWADGITDQGLARLAGLTRLERITIGGKSVTDKGLTYLSGMKRLDNLSIQGDFTSQGLLQLEQNPSLAVLFLVCPQRPDEATVKRLTENLPHLGFFQYGPDLQKMRPIGTGRAGAAGYGMGATRRQ